MNIQKLEAEILRHKQLYYAGKAEISDGEYDMLEEELCALDPNSLVLKTVGATLVDAKKKVKHTHPMLSLDKCREAKDILKWMGQDYCVATFKLDGSSASLIYQNGVLKVAKTRGDGSNGENITEHIRHMTVPMSVKDFESHSEIEVRGEVCISKDKFEDLCKEMEERKLERPKSIRNIVAGLLHRETDKDLCCYLDFIAYEMLGGDALVQFRSDKFFEDISIQVPDFLHYEIPQTSNLFDVAQALYFDRLKLLGDNHFKVPIPFGVSPTLKAVEAMIEYYQETLDQYDYLCDGLVFAINNITAQENRGSTDHHPKGKMAFKLASEVKTTVVKDILVDVGRTGQLSFVGVVEPVELSGAMVEKVTLHNLKYIKDHRINIGVKIEITRSGEVIPKHVRTIEYGLNNLTYIPPIVCPICNFPLKKTRVNLMCPNSDCAARVKGSILHWIETLKIYDIGISTVEKLYEYGLVKSVEDLYTLSPIELVDIEKLGPKSALKIVTNIQETRTVSIEKLLTALGIDGLGKGVSKLLVRRFKTLENMLEADMTQLLSIEGIGGILAENIINGFKDNKDFLSRMNFDIQYPEFSSDFEGKSFVITGALSKPREEIQAWIEQRGGKVVGSVSKKTSYLVCNQVSNSSKYKKASSLGTGIITEEKLYELG